MRAEPFTTLFPFPAVQLPGAFRLAQADFNQDGYPDAATITLREVAILFGQCDGSMELGSTIAFTFPWDLEAADFDLDGDADLVVLDDSLHLVIFLLNNGAGQFVKGPEYPFGHYAAALTVADFNRDGRPDVAAIATDSDPGLYLYESSGTQLGYSTSVISSGSLRPISLTHGDIDGDGWPDLIVGHLGEEFIDEYGDILYKAGRVTFLRNGRHGAFHFPVIVTQKACEADWLGASDLDHDGNDDIIALYRRSGDEDLQEACDCSTCAITYRYRTGGLFGIAGRLVVPPFSRGPTGASLVDFDQDGQPEVIAGSYVAYDDPKKTPIIPLNTDLSLGPQRGVDLAASATGFGQVDAGNDGIPDVIVVGNDTVSVHPISARFNPEQPLHVSNANRNLFVTIADIDSKGLLDIFLYPGNSLTYLQMTPGEFILAGQQYLPDFNSFVEFLDLDGIGLPEMVGETSSGISIYREAPSAGRYILSQSFNYPWDQGEVRGWDPDHDGDADLVYVQPYREDFLYTGSAYFLENDGHGYFSEHGMLEVAGGATNILPMDVDGDGTLDLAIGTTTRQGPQLLEIYRGISAWDFERTQQIPIGFAATILGMDLDGDGRQEVILPDGSRSVLQVFCSDAAGRVALRQELTTSTYGYVLSSADVDGDGLEDLVVPGESAFSVHRNRGTGLLDPGESFFISRRIDFQVTATNVTGDGQIVAIANDSLGSYFRVTVGGRYWSTQPSLRLSASAFRVEPGEHLRLKLEERGARKESAADVYLGLMDPTGSLLFLTSSGSSEEPEPFVRDLRSRACEGWSKIWQVDRMLPDEVAPGTYQLLAVATSPNTAELLDFDRLIIEVSRP